MLYDIIIKLVESRSKDLTHMKSSTYIFLDLTALLIIRRTLGQTSPCFDEPTPGHNTFDWYLTHIFNHFTTTALPDVNVLQF